MKVIFPITSYQYRGRSYYANPRISHDGPLFFLAGPILGGGLWQLKAHELLKEKMRSPFVVASPCRFESSFEVQGSSASFVDQLEWEIYYFSLATKNGCVLFWLPEEDKFYPRTDGCPYAMMTRDEIGRGREVKRQVPNSGIVMGGENSFPGIAEIERYNNIILGEGILPINPTLEMTVDAAIKYVCG